MCTARTLQMHVLMHMLMHMLMHVLMHMLLCICIYVVYAPHAYLPTTQADLRKLDEIIASCPGVGTICLDVANGYSEAFVATVKEVRGASCMCTACALYAHVHVQRSHCVRPACEVRACLLHVLHPACLLHTARGRCTSGAWPPPDAHDHRGQRGAHVPSEYSICGLRLILAADTLHNL